MEVFSKIEAYEYFENLKKKIQEEISTISDDEIQNTDKEELYNYYFEKWKMQPLTLFLEELNPVLTEEKVKRYSGRYRTDEEFCYYDGYKITYNINFDGDNRLFDVIPSTRFMQIHRVSSVQKSTNEKYGIITYIIDYTKQEIEGKDTPDFAKKQFDASFKNIKETINNLNNDVNQYNVSIQYTIKNCLEARKKKSDDYFKLSKNMAIPLKLNPFAPNVEPILLKKNIIKKPDMPKKKEREPEYTISSNDYENIRRIIGMAGYSMEKGVKTFNKFEEEELRDIFLAFLNTHYKNMATGETFTGAGKADIHIQFDNKAAYIAECKVWHGEKQFQNAIEQLFSYTTWHDVKTSIIIFNKDNKDFNKLLNTINVVLDKNELCQKKISIQKNEWLCEFKKSKEMSSFITVQIIIFDLFLTEK